MMGYCVPDNADSNQVALVVSKYLRDNPDQLNEEKDYLILKALK